MAKKSIKKLEFLTAISGARYSFAKGALEEIGKLIDTKEGARLVKAGIAKYISVPAPAAD